MKKLAALVFVTVALVSLTNFTVAGEKALKPPVTPDDIMMTATLIDLEKLMVTLTGPKGNILSLTVGNEAKNFPRGKVGESVEIDYYNRERQEDRSTISVLELTITATVETIYREKRLVILKGSDGNRVSMTLGDEARNFPQLKVGDEVRVGYFEAMALQLETTKSVIKNRIDELRIARSPIGKKPAGRITKTTEIVAKIQAIDLDKRLVTVRGVKRTVTLMVNDDVKLDKLKVNDKLVVYYLQEMTILVKE